jgi:acetate kinase
MTYILVINAGSSSLKYQLIDIDEERVIAKGICERIGIAKSVLSYKTADGDLRSRKSDEDARGCHQNLSSSALADPKRGVIEDMSCIKAVGHRVLHAERSIPSGADDDQVLEAIEECIPMARCTIPRT